MHHDCSIYEKCFNFLLNSCFFGKMVLLRKLKLIYPSTPQHYSNCSAFTFLNFAKYAMTMHSIWERLQSYYHSIWQIFYLSHNVWRKLKNHMKIDIPNIASHFIFLTQIYYNLNFITSSSISSQDFPGTLRSILANCFWRIFFVAHKKCIFLNMSAKFVLKN